MPLHADETYWPIPQTEHGAHTVLAEPVQLVTAYSVNVSHVLHVLQKVSDVVVQARR